MNSHIAIFLAGTENGGFFHRACGVLPSYIGVAHGASSRTCVMR